MALIDDILNGEVGSSVRSKLNAVIAFVNDLKTKVTENSVLSVFWGVNTGDNVTTGENNTAIGAEALEACDTGSDNTAVGARSQEASKYGGRNSTLGSIVMQNIINGNYGLALGYQSQGSGKFIWRNVSAGYKAMRNNLVGHDNVAVGYKALQDMEATAGVISAWTDLGAGKIQVTSAGHGRSNGETLYIVGTGPWLLHAWETNYDGSYVIESVTTDTFVINATYVDPVDLLDNGCWFVQYEAVGNMAIGYAAGISLGKGSYNTLIGYNQQADDPDSNWQLAIHAGLIKGFYGGDIRQRWVQVDGKLILAPHTDVPYGATEGAMYFNTTDKHFYGYNGTAWVQLDN